MLQAIKGLQRKSAKLLEHHRVIKCTPVLRLSNDIEQILSPFVPRILGTPEGLLWPGVRGQLARPSPSMWRWRIPRPASRKPQGALTLNGQDGYCPSVRALGHAWQTGNPDRHGQEPEVEAYPVRQHMWRGDRKGGVWG